MRFLPPFSFAMVILGAMAVASCEQTPYSDLVKTAVSKRGASAADSTLENLEWGLCSAATIGSIKRRYVGTRKWAAYGVICEWPERYIEQGLKPTRLLPRN